MEQHGALHGIKVLDFTISVVGPYVSTYLGNFGAEVVKVETNLKPDITRLSTPFKDEITGVDHSGLFNYINHSQSHN